MKHVDDVFLRKVTQLYRQRLPEGQLPLAALICAGVICVGRLAHVVFEYLWCTEGLLCKLPRKSSVTGAEASYTSS